MARAVNCRKCHSPGAEEPDEIVVVKRRTTSDGSMETTLRCERCGFIWVSERGDLSRLPGFKRADAERAKREAENTRSSERGMWWRS